MPNPGKPEQPMPSPEPGEDKKPENGQEEPLVPEIVPGEEAEEEGIETGLMSKVGLAKLIHSTVEPPAESPIFLEEELDSPASLYLNELFRNPDFKKNEKARNKAFRRFQRLNEILYGTGYPPKKEEMEEEQPQQLSLEEIDDKINTLPTKRRILFVHIYKLEAVRDSLKEETDKDFVKEVEQELILRNAKGFQVPKELIGNLKRSPHHRYLTLGRIAEGRMGAKVDLVMDIDSDDEDDPYDVLKSLRVLGNAHNNDLFSRFQREARTAASVNSPHIIELRDAYLETDLTDEANTFKGGIGFVMELANGPNVEQLAEQAGGKLPPEQILEIISQVLTGLEKLHEKNIVHRDLKPANILSQKEALKEEYAKKKGQPYRLTFMIGDFGIVKQVEEVAERQSRLKKILTDLKDEKITEDEVLREGVEKLVKINLRELLAKLERVGYFDNAKEQDWSLIEKKHPGITEQFAALASHVSLPGEPSLTMEDTSVSGHTIGTPFFMAPEQIVAEKLTTAADIFSIGQIMYYLISGQYAFSARSRDKLMQKIASYNFTGLKDLLGSEGRTDVDDKVISLVGWAMERYEDDRPTAKQLREEIERYRKGQKPSAEFKKFMKKSKRS